MSEDLLNKQRMAKINAGFAAYLDVLKESGGSMSKMVVHQGGKPIAALIVVRGEEEAAEVITALEDIEEGWQ